MTQEADERPDRAPEDGGGGLTRRKLLARGGAAAAGAAAAGGLAGRASAARRTRVAAAPRRGGHVTWAIEQDPTALAPFGVLPGAAQWGKEFMYDSLLEWDAKINIKPALAESYVVKDPRTIDWTLRKGVRFHNGKELTASDAHYSFQLQANPPLPGSPSVLSFFPAIADTQVLSKYKLRMKLKKPDASVFGYLAWDRWSPIVPQDLYKQVNVVNQGIGTGPFKLDSYTQNDRVEYSRWGRFWKQGQPYLDQLTLKIMTDEQARIAALRAGAIDGATIISGDNARALAGDKNLTVLKGLTAAFRELQFTIKAGENKPWADRRVRQAINLAIDRQDIIAKVYAGDAVYTGHIPPGYGDWPLSQDELKTKYEKFDLPAAQKLMKDAGFAKGFEVAFTIVGLSEYPTLAVLLKAQLAKIGIDVNIKTEDLASFAADYGKGNFEWLLNGRGMRGDPHGFVGEFNPGASPSYNLWFSGYKNVPMWRLVGNGQITLDHAKRLPMYKKLQELLLTELLEIPLVVPYKYQVVNKRVHDMYVSFTDFNPGLRTVWVDK